MTDASQQSPTLRTADRVDHLDRSKIRVMFDLAAEYDGDSVRLHVGEPDFDTPEHVLDAADRAAREGETHYTVNQGIPPLREAIAEKHDRESCYEDAPEQLTDNSVAK
jgi:aspartate aminotransferase